MVGTMTIITSFLSPYVVKFGWKIGDRSKNGVTERKSEEQSGREDGQR
jgi:CPA2 family monovalent cation:H+ antiporter-2